MAEGWAIMDQAIWQRLLALESRDIVSNWFFQLHGRQLNARRSKEINAAARQAREFYKSANVSSVVVRPLLTFYGVASLARALVLLFRRDGGEHTLTMGHGIKTIGWSELLVDDIGQALSSLRNVKIKTCAGLFSSLVADTHNLMPIHIRSSAVDWRFNYPQPAEGVEISLIDLITRIPDLNKELRIAAIDISYAGVSEMQFSTESGFKTKLYTDKSRFSDDLTNCGYSVSINDGSIFVEGDVPTFSASIPQFMHSYIETAFRIPVLHITTPLSEGARYSQLCVTYIAAYVLGMLARYFPTQWTALSSGEKGDVLWPTIHSMQNYVEIAFPILVEEVIMEVLKFPDAIQE